MKKDTFMNQRRAIILSGATLIFSLITLLITLQVPLIQTGDQQIRQLVNHWRSPWFSTFMVGITRLFDPTLGAFIITLTILSVWYLTNRWRALQVATTIFSGTLINHMIKAIVNRPRPNVDILLHYNGFSFPSGHSATAMVVFGSLFLFLSRSHYRWRTGLIILLAILIFLVGFSRLYVGAHYLSDVIAGWSLGLMIISGLDLIFDYIKKDR